MIPVLIFWLHVNAGVYLFVKRYHEETLSEAFLSLGFAAIIFTAGWTLSSFIIRISFGQRGIDEILNGDSLSLILLTIFETIFYKVWFRKSSSGESTPSSDQASDA
jgi:hypothetical protein